VISTIFLDHSEAQKADRGIRGTVSKYIAPDTMEYMKAVARWIKNGETIKSKEYIVKGHKASIQQLVQNASFLLPNSENEYRRFEKRYQVPRPYKVIYNGIDTEIFSHCNPDHAQHDPKQVLCVARIEGNKNQLNLIKALNNTPYKLKIVGKPAPNHMKYYEQCRKIAANNISFEGFVSQEELIRHYMLSKVHVLPSWNETCGLSSLEAGYMKCNIVITDKGDTEEYFGNNAWYCDPGDPSSIYNAIVNASEAPVNLALHNEVMKKYNWEEAALQTKKAYEEVLKINRAENNVTHKHLYQKEVTI
jgi:glycosyltransferase involved in cell wall biosynthesis